MRPFVFVAAAALLGAGPAPAAPPPRGNPQDILYLGDQGPLLVRLHLYIDGEPYETAWQEFVTTVFKYLDANGDGVLDSNEAGRAPTPQMLFGAGFFNAFRTPAVIMDFNRDGKVTKEELAKFYRDNGGAPFQFRGGSQGRRNLAFAQGGLGAGSPAPTADALNEKIFQLLDTNKDGKLSKAELAAAPAILNGLDADDDEMVSIAELLPNTVNPYRFAVAPPGAMAPVTNNSSFLLMDRRQSGVVLARQLLAHYGAKKGQPPRKKLTREALGLDKETFAKLDADEDGELDAEELARFARRPPDREFIVRLGKKPGGPLLEAVPPRGPAAARAGKVRKTEKESLLLDLGITRLVMRGQSSDGFRAARQARQRYLAQFKAADRDNNGYLDQKEAQQSPFFRNAMKLMDRNGDGKLFEKEMLTYLDKMEVLQAAARKACISLTVSDQGKGIFDLLDTNHDGRLGLREMRQLPNLLGQLDRDGDGNLARNEVPRSYQLTFRQGPGGNPPGVTRIAYPGMMGGRPLPSVTAGPRWFRKMDRNHDGDVSRREFLGTDEEFRRIDTDGDGLISAEEADRYDKLRRKEP